MKIRVNIDIKVGRVVKFFVLSDLFFLAGRGFVDPIFSIFIIQKVQGANLATVGTTHSSAGQRQSSWFRKPVT